jgi:hypothetical protein
MSKIIMGIQMLQRRETAQAVQGALTDFGCYIKTRLGVHQASADMCSEQGLIILEFIDDADKQAKELKDVLTAIENVTVKTMIF